ncbi:hypothetical protein FH972_024406 [Carpinus fangiana]|uniref:Uncharacterized protein n=1 Tax=Carpinus fangiana TaxID=176857 RepID=A0A5N6KXY1_9ROSI|nr:hypothetical protein FH972_024406 [Carpinus fangiana]
MSSSADFYADAWDWVERFMFRIFKAAEDAQHRHRKHQLATTGKVDVTSIVGLPVDRAYSTHHGGRTFAGPTPDEGAFFPVHVLHWHGCIDFDSNTSNQLKHSDLRNHVLPLFSRERFEPRCRDVYDILEPGLQLASLFIIHPAFGEFWHTLHFGQREYSADLSRIQLKSIYEVRDKVTWTAEGQIRFKAALSECAKTLIIAFINSSDADASGMYSLNGFCKMFNPERDHSHRDHTFIGVHRDYYATARRFRQLGAGVEPAQVLRFYFSLACCLVHEVGHLVERASFQREVDDESTAEYGYYSAETVLNDGMDIPEAGYSFEKHAFGGMIECVNEHLDGSHGLTVSKYTDGHRGEEAGQARYGISMHYIAKLFQRDTWRLPLRCYTPGCFHVPKREACVAKEVLVHFQYGGTCDDAGAVEEMEAWREYGARILGYDMDELLSDGEITEPTDQEHAAWSQRQFSEPYSWLSYSGAGDEHLDWFISPFGWDEELSAAMAETSL